MGLTNILVLAGIALAWALVFKQRGRGWFLLVASALAVYWLQPLLPIRGMDFWLPTLTLALAVLSWIVTTPPESRDWRRNWPAAAVLSGVVLLLDLTRFIGQSGLLTAGRPPLLEQVALVLLVLAGLGLLLARLKKMPAALLTSLVVLLIVLLVVLKLPALAQLASGWLRALVGQSAELATANDLRWLGFSYVAFRLVHTLRDRQSGRLPLVSLQEYVIYVIFFPAFVAGPIDRLERFIKDLRKPLAPVPADYAEAGKRLLVGLFKKFVVADTLALVALNAANAGQARSAGWLWLLLYAYAFQIFFDFSGYTDIAIGLGRLAGIALPENFNAPYLKPNLTLFWNNWHMTLTQWFRAYYFNPLTRWLRSGERRLVPAAIIFITQLSTFVLIGLWHGVTLNFVVWGAWHGLGLFLQNRYSEWVRPRLPDLTARPYLKQGLTVAGVLLTFHYVTLGWVWFALPSLDTSWQVLRGLLIGVR
jgi:alginate O-acetyltransferase complex protein AlgI